MVLLNNGTVMVTGGWDVNNNALVSTEIYDPVGGTFAPTGSLNTPRGQPTATLLPNGQALIAGGAAYFIQRIAWKSWRKSAGAREMVVVLAAS
ncbi:MAG TPA: kelch repeat-containing protein [Terriglobia bacterium]|nr:kelch repeat-containing protein [Terriglobia bacterium]